MEGKIVLIDGYSIINRAFYGVPELTNSKGLHTNGVYGFLNIMFKILEEEHPDYLAVAFDVKAPTFRHELYKEYKGTRKGMPTELLEQVPVLKDVLCAMQIPTIEKAGYEADDILGTLATISEKEGLSVSLVSGDRDLLQLASEKICIRIPKTKRGTTTIEDYFTKDVVEAYGVTPTEFIDMKALMGDSSDNIHGVPGIGEKTAAKLIMQYHSIEAIYEHIDEVKPTRAKNSLIEHPDSAKLSKVLVTIKTDCELDFSLEDAKLKDLYTPEAYELLKGLEFKKLLERFESTVSEQSVQWEVQVKEEVPDLKDLKDSAKDLALAVVHENEKLLGLSITFSDKESYYIEDKEAIKKLLSQISVFTTLNLKEQLRTLWREKMDYEPAIAAVDDLAIGAYLINPLKDTYDYDDLARDYLDEVIPSRQDLFKKLSLEKAKETEHQAYLNYCGYLSAIPYRAKKAIYNQLEENQLVNLYREIEMPLVLTLYHMEKEGIGVNRKGLEIYGAKLSEKISVLEQEIFALCGEEFNIQSPKQLGVILFEKLGLPCSKKTKTGYSTAADVLEKLRPKHPVIDMILEYRQLTKLKSTYADGLSTFIEADGRIHGKFHQTITATGRISSTEPNLQNIPIRMEIGKKIREVFVPAEGKVFIDADYSQIELRVLAHLSNDKRLIDAYNQAEDIHAITASQVFHVPLEEVTPQLRRNAKAVNFGIIYGLSAFGLSEDLSISRKEAASYIEKYFETYPSIKNYLDYLVKKAKDTGKSETMFGRIRPVPELNSSNFMQRQFGERIAMNAPIQGTAADIIKIAMVRVDQKLREEGLKSRLLLQVHDELLVEAVPEELEQVREILDEQMRGAAKLSVVLETDRNEGKNWLEAH
ncbi:DNA polymerase I [Lachnospiraceae bacterium TWA4]|nr:DNA polymerase I [Lachnospiraceae bacterium TWA4]